MKIENLKVMRGPNYWSRNRNKLIVMQLNISGIEAYPQNMNDLIRDSVEQLDFLYERPCLFVSKEEYDSVLHDPISVGEFVKHIVLELLFLSGNEYGHGEVHATHNPDIYTVVFAYESEAAGVYAAHATVRFINALINGRDTHTNLIADIETLKNIHDTEKYAPGTQSILDEAVSRGIPYARLDNEAVIILGQGKNQKIISAGMASTTSRVGVAIAADKERTKAILSNAYIPVPKGNIFSCEEELTEIINNLGFPLVIKPVNKHHGQGVTTNITNLSTAIKAFNLAKSISTDVVAEQFIKGWSYRFLVVNYKLIAVAKCVPAMVMGNGVSTIQQLIDDVNSNPERGTGTEKTLTKIEVDKITQRILTERQLTLDTVLPFAEILLLKDTTDISTGGTAIDLTDKVHPANVFLAERIARMLHLDICGIDIIAADINIPVTEKNGAVIGVNANPGFRMHLAPSKGLGRNVGSAVIDMLFPANTSARIPLVAVTGTNGKTTTTRLIAHIAKTAGHMVGFTTTDGIYINDHMIHKGDCSGPSSAAVILRDPTVDFAVLECARGGILRSGLGFDKSDISIVTNITEDHIGTDGIATIEELAKVKMVVPGSTSNNGYAILNADDELVYKMRYNISCNVALFSMHKDNPHIAEHCQKGGLAAYIDNEYIIVSKGKWQTRIAKIDELPLTFLGTATCMIQNILPAVLTGVIRNFDIRLIARALKTFIPSIEQTPGRMNLLHFQKGKLMVDYAHNEAGFIELKKYIDKLPNPYKIGIIAGTGDRRDEDIRKIGFYAAQMFDEIIIRDDKDLRGRTSQEMSLLIAEEISKTNPEALINIIPDELEALRYALGNAPAGAFILACADDVHQTIAYATTLKEEEKQGISHQLFAMKYAS